MKSLAISLPNKVLRNVAILGTFGVSETACLYGALHIKLKDLPRTSLSRWYEFAPSAQMRGTFRLDFCSIPEMVVPPGYLPVLG